MSWKWQDVRLNIAGLTEKTNYDPRRLGSLWTPDPYILNQRSQFSGAIMKKSESLRVYPGQYLKYSLLQTVRSVNPPALPKY